MTHPQMPHIPGATVMNDTLDFVKNLWGSMSVPGLTAPTLSVEVAPVTVRVLPSTKPVAKPAKVPV